MKEVKRLNNDADSDERIDKINEIVDALTEVQHHISQGL